MAKYEKVFNGDFDTVLEQLDKEILGRSATASFEEGSNFYMGGVRCAVRVYERYSVVGSNRLSLTLTLIGDGASIHLVAMTSGGSSGMFFNVIRWGEDAFLDTIRDVLDAL